MPSNEKDKLTPTDRVGELFSVQLLMLMFGFFLYHQLADTGFFTDEFGFVEMLALYGPLFLAMDAPVVRAITGRKNPARPFDAFANICLVVGTFWLLEVFPLDYTHLADALPKFLRFILSWVTDDMARIVFVIMIVVNSITAVVNLVRFVTFPRTPSRMLS